MSDKQFVLDIERTRMLGQREGLPLSREDAQYLRALSGRLNALRAEYVFAPTRPVETSA
jgi:hypothetical protein